VARSERILLEAEHPSIFKQELQQAIGFVKAARLIVRDERTPTPTITTLPVNEGEVVHVRTIGLAKQVGGAQNAASWELVGTFQRVGGVLYQAGSTTMVTTHENDTDWGMRYEVVDDVLYVKGEFNGVNDSLDLHVVFNTYSYLHTLLSGA
jgi:hypothetical protein